MAKNVAYFRGSAPTIPCSYFQFIYSGYAAKNPLQLNQIH